MQINLTTQLLHIKRMKYNNSYQTFYGDITHANSGH